MPVLVSEIARIYSDRLLAILANVRRNSLKTLSTEGLPVLEHIPLASQICVALPAQEVVNVAKALLHDLEIFI